MPHTSGWDWTLSELVPLGKGDARASEISIAARKAAAHTAKLAAQKALDAVGYKPMLREIDRSVGSGEGELVPPSWGDVIEHFEERLRTEAEESAVESMQSAGEGLLDVGVNRTLGVDHRAVVRDHGEQQLESGLGALAGDGEHVPAGNRTEVRALEALLRIKQTEKSLSEVRERACICAYVCMCVCV